MFLICRYRHRGDPLIIWRLTVCQEAFALVPLFIVLTRLAIFPFNFVARFHRFRELEIIDVCGASRKVGFFFDKLLNSDLLYIAICPFIYVIFFRPTFVRYLQIIFFVLFMKVSNNSFISFSTIQFYHLQSNSFNFRNQSTSSHLRFIRQNFSKFVIEMIN